MAEGPHKGSSSWKTKSALQSPLSAFSRKGLGNQPPSSTHHFPEGSWKALSSELPLFHGTGHVPIPGDTENTPSMKPWCPLLTFLCRDVPASRAPGCAELPGGDGVVLKNALTWAGGCALGAGTRGLRWLFQVQHSVKAPLFSYSIQQRLIPLYLG